MFGDGFTQTSEVESNQSPRIHPLMGTTVRFALMCFSALKNLADFPIVIRAAPAMKIAGEAVLVAI